ncbi:IS200/IS605 family transposase [Prosthecobacter sp. SYSU 5D2]|uniref:IS200/IS605 family transposase n=1 Tax=Prosthecobacter sp. SYSU 5D2 TaxID=3134134 RepID=UPI0031FE5293
MATYTQILYHIVFSTKHRERVLDAAHREDLFRFIWGVLQNRQCHLYRIGGVEDHLHMLVTLHPCVALADLVKEIKTSSSAWIKGQNVFPAFSYWQEGYGAFTCSLEQKPALIDYIRNQEVHHRQETFQQEYQRLLSEAGLAIHELDKEWRDPEG